MNLRNKAVPGTAKGLGPVQREVLKRMKDRRVSLDDIYYWRFFHGERSMSYLMPFIRALERRKLIRKTRQGWWETCVADNFWGTL